VSRRVRVEVTAEDIAKGERAECGRCPVALACKRVLPGARVMVDGCSIDFTLKPAGEGEWDDWTSIEAPAEVDAFIQAFDDGHPVAPFAFDLDIPEAS
jgi:hypothetical protein